MSQPTDTKDTLQVGKLVANVSTLNLQVVSLVNQMNACTNINVGTYMKLQVAMNTLSQSGQLLTGVVNTLNSLIVNAISHLQPR